MHRVAHITCWLALTAGALAAPPRIDLQLVASQLSNVTGIAHAGDGSGRLFVAEQGGRIKILSNSTVIAAPYLNISSLLVSTGEQGLLGLAFDPGYATNGHFYVYYTHSSGNSNIVARFTATPPSANVVNPSTRSEVINLTHTNHANHNGGCIQFGPDGYLYIATGDGGGSCDPLRNAQNLNSPLGKLLRVDVRTATGYQVPPDNPFVGGAGLDEIWARGLRNPWRFSFDRATGDLWIGDVGQGQREEVNFQATGSPGGQNYGWPNYEGFLTNTCAGIVGNFAHTLPLLDYDHTGSRIAITGGYRYRGAAIPPLVGTYLFADEKSAGPLYGATQSLAGVWSFVTLTNTPYTIATFGEDEAGEVYVSRYANTTVGGVYRIIWKDTDGDGLPDDWEQEFFGSATGGTAGLDSDGDGLTNLQEFRTSTNPLDPASALRVTATGPTGSDWMVTFASRSNKLYRLERTDDLGAGTWTTITNNVPGTGNPITLTDTNAAGPQLFYRIQIEP